MKSILTICLGLLFAFHLQAQKIEIYNPKAEAKSDISLAVKKARAEGKHVFLQIGGNWCPWCIKFHRFVDADPEIKKLVEDNFVAVKVNYSPENRNETILANLDFPQRFGFPVFVILNAKGQRIHTQNSAYLEEGDSYNKKNVVQFFKHWTPKALDPESYKAKAK